MNTAMRNLILVCAIVVLSGVGSALAQKPIVIIGPPAPFDQTLNVEDDGTGDFLVFGTRSGKYAFTRCSDGFKISGVGFVKVDGCSIHIEDVQSDHRVVASINECDQQAKAIVEKFAQATDGVAPFKAFLSDANMGNSLLDCAPKK